MTPLVFKKEIALPLPTQDDKRAHDQRIKDTLEINPLSIPLSVLRRIPAEIRQHDYRLSFIISRTGNGYKIVDVSRELSYSLALDLGTTNLVLSLYDNINQKSVCTMSFENPQSRFGSDILSRLHHAMAPSHASTVYDCFLKGVNAAIRSISHHAGIDTNAIHALVAAGNTVMTHFFLGLDVSTIPMDPFVPVSKAPGFIRGLELSLDINPEAVVYVFPNAGSYVGGDTIAGMLASGMYLSDDPAVLIDVGTNVEIAIGNKDWVLVGAGAAGPALEEGISMIGKKATKGIIYDVEIRDDGITCKTFDDAPPEGICGSGMVSLLYEMYKAGLIDQRGSLNASRNNVVLIGEEKAFEISCTPDRPLYIRQGEIVNFLKSKGAFFTLLLVLVRSIGLQFKDIKSVSVAGALGTGIDVTKAIGLGILPSWPGKLVKPLGNSSLKGAEMVIQDSGLIAAIDSITDKITYKHMHDDPEFMREFMGAVFIPNTNPDLLQV